MVYIPTLKPDEERAMREVESRMDAALEARGGIGTFKFANQQQQTPELTAMAWRALIKAYEDAGYEVHVTPATGDLHAIVSLRGTPRVQKQ